MNDRLTPPPPVDEDTRERLLDAFRNTTELDLFLLDYRSRHDPRLLKYRKRLEARDKTTKHAHFRNWWWSKGIQIVNLVLALIAAVTGVIALLR